MPRWSLPGNVPSNINSGHEYPRLEVKARKGEVFIRVDTGLTGLKLKSNADDISARIEEIALNLGGARKVKVRLAGLTIPIE